MSEKRIEEIKGLISAALNKFYEKPITDCTRHNIVNAVKEVIERIDRAKFNKFSIDAVPVADRPGDINLVPQNLYSFVCLCDEIPYMPISNEGEYPGRLFDYHFYRLTDGEPVFFVKAKPIAEYIEMKIDHSFFTKTNND